MMTDNDHPGCLARWFFLVIAGLLIGAILAGALHAWNPTIGILAPASWASEQTATKAPTAMPTLPPQTTGAVNNQATPETLPSVLTSTAAVTSSAPVTMTALPAARRTQGAANAVFTATTTITATRPATASTTASDEDVRFFAQAQTLFTTYVTQLETLSQRMMVALDDPTQVDTPGWREETAAQVAEMRAVGIDVRALIAPSRYATAWDDMRIATVFIDRALDALMGAVETRSPEQVQEAHANLQIAVEAVNRAAAALRTTLPAVPPASP